MQRDLNISYEIRRSGRAKHGRIVVRPGGVEFVAPKRMSERQIAKFIQEKQNWIQKQLKIFEEKSEQLDVNKPTLIQEWREIQYAGKKVPLKIEILKCQKIHVFYEEGEGFRICVPNTLNDNEQNIQIRLSFEKWGRKQAKEKTKAIINQYEALLALRPRRIFIKQQKHMWGSCSSKKNININWLLIFAPKQVMTYVVLHELCHLEEMNHSKKFWCLVKKLMPDYKIHRAWLKKYGMILRHAL